MFIIHTERPFTPSTPQPFNSFSLMAYLLVYLVMTLIFTHVSWQTETDESTGQLSHSVSLLFFFFPLCKNTNKWANRQTQVPAVPVIPVTFLISSELLSMPAVKRFSVSFARHPSNGMSAFIQVYIETPPDFLILHELFVGKHFVCFLFFGSQMFGCVNYIKGLQDLKRIIFLEFLFHYTPLFGVCCVLCCFQCSHHLTPRAVPAPV